MGDASHIMTLWQASSIAFTAESQSGSILLFRRNAAMGGKFFRVENIDGARAAKKRAELIDSLELGGAFDRAAPVGELRNSPSRDLYWRKPTSPTGRWRIEYYAPN